MDNSMMLLRRNLIQLCKYISVIIAIVIVLVPLYIVVVNSFKTLDEYAKTSIFTMPGSFFYFDNFAQVIKRGKFLLAFKNIGIILIISLAGNILIGTMVTYALGRFQFKLKPLVIGAYSLAVLIPGVTTQVATFSIVKNLGLLNSLAAPIILYLGTNILQIYLYLQFIRNIPVELDESAMMEGASLLKIYRTIILPLMVPAIATNLIIKMIDIYNDMYTPYLYMPALRLNVVSTVLMRFTDTNGSQWNLLSTAIVIIVIPSVIVYLFMQRYIFAGIVSGGVK